MSKKNANAALILAFLYKCVEVFTSYFKDLEEESVRDNFVVIYELLDEMMDFGCKTISLITGIRGYLIDWSIFLRSCIVSRNFQLERC